MWGENDWSGEKVGDLALKLGKLLHMEASRGETGFLMGALNASEMDWMLNLLSKSQEPVHFREAPDFSPPAYWDDQARMNEGHGTFPD